MHAARAYSWGVLVQRACCKTDRLKPAAMPATRSPAGPHADTCQGVCTAPARQLACRVVNTAETSWVACCLSPGCPGGRPLAHRAYVLPHAAERAAAQLLAQLRRLAVCAHAFC